MSPLTKIFVALLVVLSLLLTAATVTFVNTIGDYRADATVAREEIRQAEQRSTTAVTAAEAQRAALNEQVAALTTQLGQARNDLNTARQELVNARAQVAQLQNQAAVSEVTKSQLAAALQASESTTNQIQNQIANLRQTADQRLQEVAELTRANTDLSNTLDVTERERRFLEEQLVETRRSVEQAQARLRDLGDDPARLATGGVGRGAPRIEGTVRQTQEITGQLFATLSVGSDDAVRRGMQFTAISPDGRFLGTLQVERVEPNESVARFTGGPSRQDVTQGVVVRTQS